MTECATTFDSPVGPLALTGVVNDQGMVLSGLRFGADDDGDPTPFATVIAQLSEFFAGDRTRFDLALSPSGTEFQRRVWSALCGIPFAETRSYAQIAVSIGSASATRAVGAANGRNPLSIVVPCHRVVGADGSLTGFGGGLEVKRWLLDHERTVAGTALF
jgi:methylated-DNA-[protein]-cysteine S-methyltransferase